ncbi:MAG TPA: DUF1559 domain-containing protein [Planctomycetaceae bacterium]|jgi:hypothetical protein|nr:DUF1559 domain-containing protein [Planctomycetaceae bacterium]
MSESEGQPTGGEGANRNPTPLIAWIAIATVCGLLVAGTFVWQRIKRNADNTAACCENFKKIVLAMHAYHDTLGCFPPAYYADKTGRPVHSWRVLLLPFLGQRTLYNKYRFDEPWDGPHNRDLVSQMPVAFRCPTESADATNTSYVVVTGAGTVFPGASCSRIADIQDGPANTILFVEIANSGINWMDPRDLTFEQAIAGINPASAPGISGRHGPFATVATADGSIWMLPEKLSRDTLSKLLLRNDGEVIPDFGRRQGSAVQPTPDAPPPPEGAIYK